MKKWLTLVILIAPLAGWSQSNTTEALQKQHDDPFTLFFYKNTLKMINQTDNKDFDDMIKNIEKMKFLIIDKTKKAFSPEDYRKLKKNYNGEAYEEIMTSRYKGKNLDILMKDKKGHSLGTILLVNDSTSLYVLDILGTIDVKRASQFLSTLDESSEIGKKIKAFTDTGEKSKKGKKVKID